MHSVWPAMRQKLVKESSLFVNGCNMSARPRISGRMTSLAHAFVHAIIPRDINPQKQQQLFERAGIKPGECVYCGALATDSDHFRGLVKGGRPSGHFHTPDNLVPSCGTCNQSKGAADWRKWITGNAPGSPTRRNIPDVAQRIERLSLFEAQSKTVAISTNNLRDAVGIELWDKYWMKLDQIRERLLEAEKDAAIIRSRLTSTLLENGSQSLD